MENNNGKFFGVLTRSALIVRTERAAVRFCAALTPAGLALIGEERQSVERQMAQLGPADVWVDDGEECGDEVALHDRWLAQYVRVTIARRTDWEYDSGEVSVQEAKVARQVEAADPRDVEAHAWTLGATATSPPTAPPTVPHWEPTLGGRSAAGMCGACNQPGACADAAQCLGPCVEVAQAVAEWHGLDNPASAPASQDPGEDQAVLDALAEPVEAPRGGGMTPRQLYANWIMQMFAAQVNASEAKKPIKDRRLWEGRAKALAQCARELRAVVVGLEDLPAPEDCQPRQGHESAWDFERRIGLR